MEAKLILYHGSNCHFDEVDLSKSRDFRDFGRGFYTTTIQKQAEDWAEALFDRYKGDGIFIYETELELTDDLSIKKFDGLSEEWLRMVQKNRTLGGIQYNNREASKMKEKYIYKGQDITTDVLFKIEHIACLLAEKERICFDDAYEMFVSSETYSILKRVDNLFWAESAEFIVNEYYRLSTKLVI